MGEELRMYEGPQIDEKSPRTNLEDPPRTDDEGPRIEEDPRTNDEEGSRTDNKNPQTGEGGSRLTPPILNEDSDEEETHNNNSLMTHEDAKTTPYLVGMLEEVTEEVTLETRFSLKELEAFKDPWRISFSPSDGPDPTALLTLLAP